MCDAGSWSASLLGFNGSAASSSVGNTTPRTSSASYSSLASLSSSGDFEIGSSHVIRRMSADVHDARLGLCLSWRLRLCRKLKHRCLLTLMQVRQENKRAIRKFECVVMHLWYVLVDLSKDRRPGAYCSPAKETGRRTYHLRGKGELRSGKKTIRHDPGTRAEAFRSGVQRMGSATATSVIWVGHESPSLEFGAERPAHRHDHCRALNRWAPWPQESLTSPSLMPSAARAAGVRR